MVTLSKTRSMETQDAAAGLATKKWVLSMTLLGLTLIILPFIFIFVNPIQMLANFQLRIAKGTLLNELLLQEIEGAKLYVYLFNITNAERFLEGHDHILKVDEVGPFVYQEYRKNDDLEINTEPGIMRYTPNYRTELIIEESVGRPEDIFLVLPNIALLSTIQILNTCPYFIRQICKAILMGMNMKALSRISAYTYLWGNTNPLILMVNSVVPGLIYFNSTGLMTHFYDSSARYRLTLGTSDADKFQVKTVKRFQGNNSMTSQTMVENTHSYNNSYEGAAFPPQMTPETPISIYRYGICKTLSMRYIGTKQMDYGSEAFVYGFDNTTFNDHKLCDSKGWCPDGIMDLSQCFYGFPLALSKGHFLDSEPKMFEKIEGLKPIRSAHYTTFVIDPKIGVTIKAYMSMQLNLALGDMSLVRETRRLSDIFLPISHVVAKSPRMRDEAKSALSMLYTYGSYVLISVQVVCALLGIGLLAYSAKMMYWHRVDVITYENTVLSNKWTDAPLLNSLEK